MSTMPGKLIAYLTVVMQIGLTSCRNKVSPETGMDAPPPPGAENKAPIVAEFLYKDLGYKKGLITKDDIPFTGHAVQHHTNGKIKSRYEFIDGLLDGVIEEWYDNGNKSTYKLYKKGLREGITIYWDKNGQQTKQVLYRNDEEVEVRSSKPEAQKNIQ